MHRRRQRHPQRPRRQDLPDLAGDALRPLHERDQALRTFIYLPTRIIQFLPICFVLSFLALCILPRIYLGQISGNIVAPESPDDWGKNNSQWLHFSKVEDLKVTGGGVIDGRGQQWWAQSSCQDKLRHEHEHEHHRDHHHESDDHDHDKKVMDGAT